MRKNSHPVAQEELMAYLDGELPLNDAVATSEHLEHCRECQDLAADLQRVSRRLMAWQVEAGGVGITPGIAAAFNESKREPGARQPVWPSKWVWGLAACVLLLGVFSLRRSAPMAQHWSDLIRTPSPIKRTGVSAAVASLTIVNRMIARTAELTLTTKEFDEARNGLEDILKRHQGYIGQMNVSAPGNGARSLDATLRLPTDQRETAIAEIKKLGRVETESQTGEEVTQEYVDLEARLANAQNTEQRLTDILRQRTGKLADVLEVEKEIGRVRGQIEQMVAQRKSLLNRVDFATVKVMLTEDYKAQLQLNPDSMLGRFRNAAIDGYRKMVDGVAAVIRFLLAYGPSVLIWAAVLFLPVRYLWKRLRNAATRT